MQKVVIIVAGGKGKRMRTDLPKQFLLLDGIPVIMRTITNFHQFDPGIRILVVLPEDHLEYWEKLKRKFDFNISHEVTSGGNTRFHSVKNGLSLLDNPPEECIVGIHDAVRPLTSSDLLNRCYNGAAEMGNAIPAIEINESIRKIDDTKNYPLSRNSIRVIQTPQVFNLYQLKGAYDISYRETFTDDASVAEYSGYPVHLVEGDHYNLKITHPFDLLVAETLLKTPERNIPTIPEV
ncbi:MAG: 2-C-methyl-D-erythritol 4-phosphate cytidylyltransferase [Bacteroidota bacterium]